MESSTASWPAILFTPSMAAFIAVFGSILLTKLPRGPATVCSTRFARPGDSAFQAAMAATCACSYSVNGLCDAGISKGGARAMRYCLSMCG